MPRANCIIIGIEQEAEFGMIADLIAKNRHQHKLFEEPAGVRQMPFCRARISH